jgi:cytoskeletal protein RodZ
MTLDPNPVRQDLIRGLRWGAILLLVVLLTVAGFRFFGSTPAAAREPSPVSPSQSEPKAAIPEAVIEVAPSAPIVKTEPESVKEPAPRPRRASKTVPKAEKPAGPKAPVAVAPVARPVETVDAKLPDVSLAPAPVNLAVPAASTPPPPEEEPGIGSRTRGVVRSVGRFLRLGRKNDEKASDGK